MRIIENADDNTARHPSKEQSAYAAWKKALSEFGAATEQFTRSAPREWRPSGVGAPILGPHGTSQYMLDEVLETFLSARHAGWEDGIHFNSTENLVRRPDGFSQFRQINWRIDVKIPPFGELAEDRNRYESTKTVLVQIDAADYAKLRAAKEPTMVTVYSVVGLDGLVPPSRP